MATIDDFEPAKAMDEFSEAVVRGYGFDTLQEYLSMTSRVYINTPERLSRFKSWQNNDGTKAGLIKVMEVNGARN